MSTLFTNAARALAAIQWALALPIYSKWEAIQWFFPAPEEYQPFAFFLRCGYTERVERNMKRWHKRKRSWQSAAWRLWAMIEQLLWNWIERVGWQMSQRLPLVSDQRVNKKDKLCSRQYWKALKHREHFSQYLQKKIKKIENPKCRNGLNNVIVYIYDCNNRKNGSHIEITAFNINFQYLSTLTLKVEGIHCAPL